MNVIESRARKNTEQKLAMASHIVNNTRTRTHLQCQDLVKVGNVGPVKQQQQKKLKRLGRRMYRLREPTREIERDKGIVQSCFIDWVLQF